LEIKIEQVVVDEEGEKEERKCEVLDRTGEAGAPSLGKQRSIGIGLWRTMAGSAFPLKYLYIRDYILRTEIWMT